MRGREKLKQGSLWSENLGSLDSYSVIVRLPGEHPLDQCMHVCVNISSDHLLKLIVK